MSLETETLSWASLLTGNEERMPRGIGGRSRQALFFFFKARNYLPGERGKRFSCRISLTSGNTLGPGCVTALRLSCKCNLGL